jgi:hypothetical protein
VKSDQEAVNKELPLCTLQRGREGGREEEKVSKREKERDVRTELH